MRYSYEFKKKAIELFYQGKWPKTPAGVSTRTFHNQIREWVKLEQFHGPDINKFRVANQYWSPEEKYKKNISPRKLDESEYEELIRLRAENAYIKAENEVIKKEIALREEKEAARLKAKKQRLLKRSESKDTN